MPHDREHREIGASRRVLAVLSCALALLSSPGPSARAVAPGTTAVSLRNNSYDIDARLDVATRILTGRETITWRNVTRYPTSELRLHLFYNAWRNDRSSFLRSARRGPRPISLSQYGPDDWGACDVESVKLVTESGAGAGTLPTSFVQPDDGNRDDRTLMRVELPAPVGPGETVRVEVRWRLKIPRPFSRVGVIGDYFLVGHWFPKVGVFGPDNAWNAHQFIQTEFFADFGVYDVRLTVPRAWKVGATGNRVSASANGGEETHTFRAEDVHDFAWTTSPRFEVVTDRFTSPGMPPVDIELLLLPDHAYLRDRYLSSTKAALEYYGKWFRPYAWDRITIVDPPSDSNTGGMEYPMFVTSESRWWLLPGNRLMEANTIHEVGHMWFQGAVANNEFEDPWLDEGLNTFAHRRLLDVIYAPAIVEKRYFHDLVPVAFDDVRRVQPTHGADPWDGLRSPFVVESMATPAFRNDERMYYLLPYMKASIMFATLERHLGWETWRTVLAAYTDRFWFAHPTPDDFIAVVNEVSGQDLTWFFDEVYRGTDLFDYAVDRVSSAPVRAPRGYGDEPNAWSPGGTTTGSDLESVVDVRRWGGGIFPVEVRVTFDDGSVANERWDGKARWTRFRYRRPSAVRTVEVDPRHVLVLDVNYSNNSWTSRPEASTAALKWSAKWTVWLQTVLELTAFFS